MNNKYQIIFLGTPDFSCPILTALHQDSRFEVKLVITQEDKPVGRKQTLTSPPIKILAEQLEIPVAQSVKLSKDQTLIEKMINLKPDFLIVVAYGQIVSQKVLDIARIAPINIHGSILPKYRGASPIEQALLNGDKETGISIMKMTLKMDQGPVYQIIKTPIYLEDSNQSLRERLSEISSKNLPNILIQIAQNIVSPTDQVEEQATFCQKINKIDGLINPIQDSAIKVYNKWQSFHPWPGIYLEQKGKKIKLIKIKLTNQKTTSPGSFEVNKSQIFINCQDFQIQIEELQLEGKLIQTSSIFLQGNRGLLS